MMVAFYKNIKKRNVMVMNVTTVEVVLKLKSCIFLSNQKNIPISLFPHLFVIISACYNPHFMNLEVTVCKRFCLI